MSYTADEEEEIVDDVVATMLPMPVWMEQTERVIESYKGEVDTLRKQVRTYGRALTALLDDIAELKKLRKELQALLEGDK